MQSINNGQQKNVISSVFNTEISIPSQGAARIENIHSSCECVTTNNSDGNKLEIETDQILEKIGSYCAKKTDADAVFTVTNLPAQKREPEAKNLCLSTAYALSSINDTSKIHAEDLKNNLHKNEIQLLQSIVNHQFNANDIFHVRGFIHYFGFALNEFIPVMEEDDFINIITTYPNSKFHLKMPDKIKSTKTYQLLLQNEIIGLMDIPETMRSSEIYENSCTIDLNNIFIIPHYILTPDFIKAVSPYTLPFPEFKDNVMLLKTITDPSLYKCASNKIKTEIKTNHLCYNIFKNIPDSEKTAELCSKAIDNNGDNLASVPDDKKCFDLCLRACKKNSIVMKYLPTRLNDSQRNEIYLSALATCPIAAYYIPKKDIRPRHYLYACAKLPLYKEDILCSAPESLSYEELTYLYNDLELEIPECNSDEDKKNGTLKQREKTLPNERSIERYISGEIKFMSKSTQYALLSSPSIPYDLKIDFIKSIQYYSLSPSSIFINPTSHEGALRATTKFPILDSLIEKSYIYNNYIPNNLAVGNCLLKTISEIKMKTYNGNIAILLSRHRSEVTGGRTIKISRPDLNPIYVKFLKKNESFIDFKKENDIYQAIRENQYLLSQFKSEIPSPLGLTHLLITEKIKKIVLLFEDAIFSEEKNGTLEAIIYIYEASDDYSKYAHVLTDNDPTTAENAIILASSDSALLSSWGIMLTNTLPAFHDSNTKRRWVPLFSAFQKISKRNHPGCLKTWNTDATKHVDYGYSGIRDIGDFELMGSITTCLTQIDTCARIHPHNVSQRLAYFNTLVELLLSAVLVRSRLVQQLESYDHENKNSIEKTSLFIEKLCNSFFIHLIDKKETSRGNLIFEQLLGIENKEYVKWLNRTSKEIVYWTQDQCRNGGSYLKDIIKSYRISETLYPDSSILDVKSINTDLFFTGNNKLSLGMSNASFPLLSLMNGLTLACSNLLSINANKPDA